MSVSFTSDHWSQATDAGYGGNVLTYQLTWRSMYTNKGSGDITLVVILYAQKNSQRAKLNPQCTRELCGSMRRSQRTAKYWCTKYQKNSTRD